MNIYELVNKYVTAGYSENDAIPKVAQDIVLLKIGNSKYSKNITVKGGVVMHNISKDMRRATRDMDIGVHKYFDMEQDEYYFDFNIIDESVSLLINSKEQIIVEKLKSLLKFGITSTRFKDIFDFYYLINNENLDKDKLIKFIDILIFQDETMRENELKDIHIRLTNILNNNRFQSIINTANNNWLEISIKDVIDNVLEYFDGLVKVTN